MAFSGNGPVEEQIDVKRRERERRTETRMVICKEKMTLNDTDGETVI